MTGFRWGALLMDEVCDARCGVGCSARCGVDRHGATPRGIGAAPPSTISRVTAGCQGRWAPITVRTAQARHIGQVLALAARRVSAGPVLPGTVHDAALLGSAGPARHCGRVAAPASDVAGARRQSLSVPATGPNGPEPLVTGTAPRVGPGLRRSESAPPRAAGR